jgi:hypothetical protein
LIVLALLLPVFVPATNCNIPIMAQSQDDWAADIGEQLKCIESLSWSQYIGYIDDYHAYEGSVTNVNHWTRLSAESHPQVGEIEQWSDIPQPNATFWFGGEIVLPVFDAAESLYESADFHWYGESQPWFNYILPNKPPSFYEILLGTLTQGPWNCSINPQYFQDHSRYWGYHYSFSHEGFQYNVTVTYWIQAGYNSEKSYAGVLRDGSITVYNETLGKEVHVRRIRCSPAGPAIGGMYFIHSGNKLGLRDTGEYIQGEINNSLLWSPLYWPPGFEGSIQLRRNGSIVIPERMFNWALYETSTFNYSIDGLGPGLYNFTFSVQDITGNIQTAMFLLIVSPSSALDGVLFLGIIGSILLVCVGLYLFGYRKNRNPA